MVFGALFRILYHTTELILTLGCRLVDPSLFSPIIIPATIGSAGLSRRI